MVVMTERAELKKKLADIGWALSYFEEGPPKMTLYRHRASYNTEGVITDEVGTSVKNLPSEPGYVLKQAERGLLPYPPVAGCVCEWCATSSVGEQSSPPSGGDNPEHESVVCQDCGESVSALTKAGALSRMRTHAKIHA